jgi:hypothetical protein
MAVRGGAVWRGHFSATILYYRGGRAVLILGIGATGGEGE